MCVCVEGGGVAEGRGVYDPVGSLCNSRVRYGYLS